MGLDLRLWCQDQSQGIWVSSWGDIVVPHSVLSWRVVGKEEGEEEEGVKWGAPQIVLE